MLRSSCLTPYLFAFLPTGGGQPLAMTLAGSGFTDQGVYVVFTIMANVENGLITGMIDSPNNTVSTTPPNVLEFITLPIASIVAGLCTSPG